MQATSRQGVIERPPNGKEQKNVVFLIAIELFIEVFEYQLGKEIDVNKPRHAVEKITSSPISHVVIDLCKYRFSHSTLSAVT